MKHAFPVLAIVLSLMNFSTLPPADCGKYKGKNVHRGEKGGCYYLSGKQKKKVYVERKYCKC